MKLVSFQAVTGEARIGAMLPDLASVSDFSASGEAVFANMIALIEGGEAALDKARKLVDNPVATHRVEEVKLLAPVPRPTQLFDCLCFEEHLLRSSRNVHLVTGGPSPVNTDAGIPQIFRDVPVYYKGNRMSVIGANDDIVCPRYSKYLDFELEFGVFIGKRGRDWSLDEAADAIFGYSIYNDVSARDAQLVEMRGMLGPSKGKDFDTGNVIGPWLVTKDEIPSDQALKMRAWVNGELVTDNVSANMMHSFAQIVAYASRDETRYPGEFFGSGTVGGGSLIEHGRRLSDGDFIELEVENLGRQRNRIRFQ